MNDVPLNQRAQLVAQGLFGYQIDRTAKLILKVELHAEVAFRGGRSVEIDYDIDVTISFRRPP